MQIDRTPALVGQDDVGKAFADLRSDARGLRDLTHVTQRRRSGRCGRRRAERLLDKAPEIDAYPDRQDLNIELLRIATAAGTRISIGTDAHHPDELAFIWIGVAAAIEAGVRRERILI
jgi:hypothetical protein